MYASSLKQFNIYKNKAAIKAALCLFLWFLFCIPVHSGTVQAMDGETETIKFQIFSVKLNYVTDYQTLTFDKSLTPEQIFEQGFKIGPADKAFNTTLKQDASINSVTVNEDLVEIDFNSAFEKYGYGHGAEFSMLDAIVNTVGNYYGVKSVKLTVDGRSYDGGHGNVYKDDIFPVEPFKSIEFSSEARLTDEGLQDDYIYTFAGGQANPKAGEPILFVNGIFIDQPEMMITNSRSMVSVEFMQEALGVSNYWDKGNGIVNIYCDDTEISMSLNNTRALVSGKDLEMDIPPVAHNDSVYLPLSFVSEQIGYMVGYCYGYPGEGALAYNPVIWLDRISFANETEKAAGETLDFLKENLYIALENSRRNIEGGTYEEYFMAAYPEMKQDIEKITYIGQMGRFALYKGFVTFLVDMTSNEIYYVYKGNAYGGIYKVDIDNATLFHGYFAG